jgi:hypothetical protein
MAFEIEVFMKIFWGSRYKVTGKWIKLKTEELHSDIVSIIKMKRIGWTRHAMGKQVMHKKPQWIRSFVHPSQREEGI